MSDFEKVNSITDYARGMVRHFMEPKTFDEVSPNPELADVIPSHTAPTPCDRGIFMARELMAKLLHGGGDGPYFVVGLPCQDEQHTAFCEELGIPVGDSDIEAPVAVQGVSGVIRRNAHIDQDGNHMGVDYVANVLPPVDQVST